MVDVRNYGKWSYKTIYDFDRKNFTNWLGLKLTSIMVF